MDGLCPAFLHGTPHLNPDQILIDVALIEKMHQVLIEKMKGVLAASLEAQSASASSSSSSFLLLSRLELSDTNVYEP